MSGVRPALRAVAARWAETAIMGAVASFFLYQAILGMSVRHFAVSLALFGLAGIAGLLTWIAIQKARLRAAGAEPGVVRIREGRIEYFGPWVGGVADLARVTRISVVHASSGPHWVIEQPQAADIVVPAAAKGADRLAEAFAVLPGFSIGRAADAVGSKGAIVWERIAS